MKRFTTALASVIALSMPSATWAATSGTVDATMTVTYSCDITFPLTSTLLPSGSTATATSATFDYSQNANTIYDLSALTISGPASGMTGSITIYAGADTVVSNTSTSVPSGGSILGVDSASDAYASFVLNTTDSTFVAGSYSIGATLSCSESE